MKKTALKIITLAVCVFLAFSLCSCSLVTGVLNKIAEKIEGEDENLKEGWDLDHSGVVEDDELSERNKYETLISWGLDQEDPRIKAHRDCGCKFSGQITCTHWWETIRVEPTCYVDGHQKQVCKACGDERDLEILEASHDMRLVETIEPTCQAGGYELYECTSCFETERRNQTQKASHNMQLIEEVAPSCINGGYELYECANTDCGARERRNETEPSFAPWAHSFVSTGSSPTCTTAGYSDEVCELCGTYSGNREITPALGHDFENGYCIRCGEVE